MKEYEYSAIPALIGWNWELHHPKDEEGEIGTSTTGWSLTINGAIRRMKRIAVSHDMKKNSSRRVLS